MATEVKRSQIEDAVGSSRVALAADDDPQGRGIGTLLVKVGAGGRRGRGGECVEHREQREHPLATQLDREISRATPNEGSEKCVWELYPVSN